MASLQIVPFAVRIRLMRCQMSAVGDCAYYIPVAGKLL
jgi:hypothetical protein